MLRHEQILSGLDVSYDRVLVPTLLQMVKNLSLERNIYVLDVGCGSGLFTCKLTHYSSHVIGIDYSPRSIEIAKNNKQICKPQGFLDFVCSSIEEYNTCKKFDVITSNMVLHTVLNIDLVIKHIANLLKFNGRLILTLPHPLFYKSRNICGLTPDDEYITPSEHYIEFAISNDRKPLPRATPYFHRPLSFYSSLLANNELLIEKILEPYPDNELMKKYPNNWTNPRFIAFQCIKY